MAALADCSRKLSVLVLRHPPLFFLNLSWSYELGNRSETSNVKGNCDRVGMGGGRGSWIRTVPVVLVVVVLVLAVTVKPRNPCSHPNMSKLQAWPSLSKAVSLRSIAALSGVRRLFKSVCSRYAELASGSCAQTNERFGAGVAQTISLVSSHVYLLMLRISLEATATH